jgi:PKD repeat protein
VRCDFRSFSPPKADFAVPPEIRVGQPVRFRCTASAAGQIADRLWDFGEGIPEVATDAKLTFERPGAHRVTLIVWDAAGRGSRAEKTVHVLPGSTVILHRPAAKTPAASLTNRPAPG